MRDLGWELRIELPGLESPAWIKITRAGQLPPDTGDEVQAIGYLHLPQHKDKTLHPDLRFYTRCEVLGEKLKWDWGITADETPTRYRSEYAVGRTWRLAFDQVEARCRWELDKLVTALARRQQVLQNAERDDLPEEEE